MGRIHTIFQKYANPYAYLAAEGYMYRFAAAALNTAVTAPNSYATTSPTFLFKVDAAANHVLIPTEARMCQSGTVAGGAITLLMEVDNADRYTSGGTALTAINCKLGGPSIPSTVTGYSREGSAIVATNAAGIRQFGALIGPDVSPAEAARTDFVWTPSAGPDFLIPTASLGASWLINTSAATTGPTWLFSFQAAVVPLDWFS